VQPLASTYTTLPESVKRILRESREKTSAMPAAAHLFLACASAVRPKLSLKVARNGLATLLGIPATQSVHQKQQETVAMKCSMTATVALATIALLATSTTTLAISSPLDVYGANMTLQVNFQDEINSTPAIGRASVGNKQLINLARGRALTNAVPPNEVLAMVLPCDDSHPPRIVVLDKTSTNVLATVATLVDGEEAAAPRRAVIVGMLEVANTNGLAGGWLTLSAAVTLNTNGCPTRVGGKLAGVMGVIIDDDSGGAETNTVLVTGGNLSTNRKLGSIAP